ncbi:MAG: hypothetical protein KME27_12965 [Lyngbya sp. HA4199-MV5]|nr:hypothetical protein [Lyngbya sp. HA4199-MV5]
MSQMVRQFPSWLGWLLLAGVVVSTTSVTAQIPPAPPTLDAPSAPAQAGYADCQPPIAGEYLLLVVSKTLESQEQVRRTLPPNTTVTVCNYLNDVVTRVGGFTTAEAANAWAKYMRESLGLSAVVARPSEPVAKASPAPTATQTPVTSTTPAPTPSRMAARSSPRDARSYNPQTLGGGYAVLVDYFSKPALATQVQQLVGKDIGLASYRQRPYLLAVYTTDQSLANSTLQALTERGFWAMVVDSRRVTLLRQTIASPQSTVKK